MPAGGASKGREGENLAGVCDKDGVRRRYGRGACISVIGLLPPEDFPRGLIDSSKLRSISIADHVELAVPRRRRSAKHISVVINNRGFPEERSRCGRKRNDMAL